MRKDIYIKTRKQKRAITELLEKSIKVSELGALIGALNPRQVIFELRQQGFDRIILTRRFIVIDQDGGRCRPGEYYIPEHLKAIVAENLKESAKLARTLFGKNEAQGNNIMEGM